MTLCCLHRNADGLNHSDGGAGLDCASSIRGESVVLKPCLLSQDTSGSAAGPRCPASPTPPNSNPFSSFRSQDVASHCPTLLVPYH